MLDHVTVWKQSFRRVERGQWASPIVCVPKKDGCSIRICGDFKVSMNQVLLDNPYPLPDAMETGTMFSKLNLSNTYQQMELMDETQKYLWSVHLQETYIWYSHCAQHIPVNDWSNPSRVRQCEMSHLDFIILREHPTILEAVLRQLDGYRIEAKRENFEFMVPSVEYMGYKVIGDGWQPLQDKVQSIVKAPEPKNSQKLRA